jgi:selenoprotein W-related protein
LKDQLGIELELIKGGGGVFEVAVDGAVVARKSMAGFPSDEDIVRAVRKATEARGQPRT